MCSLGNQPKTTPDKNLNDMFDRIKGKCVQIADDIKLVPDDLELTIVFTEELSNYLELFLYK